MSTFFDALKEDENLRTIGIESDRDEEAVRF